jgi:alkylhydroperoxidase family enzyme
MAHDQMIPDAWVKLPEPAVLYPVMSAGGKRHPYDFGFLPAMARLMAAHPRIGAAFSALFSQIMFAPEGKLSRPEREMVAAVAAAAQDCRY